MATSFALFGAVIVLALVAASRWITAAGFSPLWGSFTFPMAAFASAMIAMGGVWQKAGFVWLVIAALAIPMIAWRVLKMWPGGKLAGRPTPQRREGRSDQRDPGAAGALNKEPLASA